MITTYRIALTAATLLLFTCPAHSQQPWQGSVSGGVVAGSAQSGRSVGHTMTIRMPAPPLHAQVVTGAPYSAEEVSEQTQTLADGTHIAQETQITKRYRDSEGRTRTERPWFMGSANSELDDVKIVEINDTVSGFRYILDTYNRVAHRFSRPESAENASAPARYTQEARALPQPTTPAPARQTQAATPPRSAGPEMSNESLGTQVIEGVSVEGNRFTRTFPVGSVGNDRPIVSVSESWFSTDLKITVLSKNSDPRSGERITRMKNISRSEPDPALFRPPADYQVIDENSERVEIKIVRP